MNYVPSSAENRSSVLADHLAGRRAFILQAWHTAVDADPELTSPAALLRPRLLQRVPQVLLDFEGVLRGGGNSASSNRGKDRGEDTPGSLPAGYDSRGLVLEWGHLHSCLLQELAVVCREQLLLDPEAYLALQDILSRLIHLATAESVDRYTRLQQQDATEERSHLEDELAALTEIIRRRATTLRATEHDLRGQLTIILSAADFIDNSKMKPALLAESSQILKRGVHTLKAMLLALIDENKPDAESESRV